jgi:hypothetical protein
VIERVLDFDTRRASAYLDLDTGEYVDPGAKGMTYGMKATPAGVDLKASAIESKTRVRLGVNLALAPVDTARWDATAEQRTSNAGGDTDYDLGDPHAREQLRRDWQDAQGFRNPIPDLYRHPLGRIGEHLGPIVRPLSRAGHPARVRGGPTRSHSGAWRRRCGHANRAIAGVCWDGAIRSAPGEQVKRRRNDEV